ncbi:MAG: radical SAM family heme chaperone HemW [Negativicutes bacterium]|nr:radical SAM family heme chaperone HemW [Negativicutes bacterium]
MKKTEAAWNESRPNLGVYIHIPFCRRKCLYCDFPSSAGMESLMEDYTTALCREITGKGGILSAHAVDTVYFGGGTPSLLPLRQLERVVSCLQRCCRLEAGAEVTLEANPGTLDGGKLTDLRGLGLNRLSIGVQSFDDHVLAAAGRIHDAAEAVRAVEEAAAGGFDNISVDLMYGLPGQSAGSFRADLEQAVALPVRHISVYGLKVEEGTPFYHDLQAGRLALPDEDQEAAMYDLAAAFLPERGFHRYEISNYGQKGAECRHNLKYWRFSPYLGMGSAAHSFIGGERSANTADIAGYIAAASQGRQPLECSEIPEPAVAMAEYAFLALRTAQGLSYQDFTDHFGISFCLRYARELEKLSQQGLLAMDGESVRLTVTGMKFGNVVFGAFLPDPKT